MASRPPGPFILEVKFEARGDGGLRAYCDELPGFVLAHADRSALLADVEPALQGILSAMYGCQVRVSKAVPLEETADMPPAHICAARYVGLSDAA